VPFFPYLTGDGGLNEEIFAWESIQAFAHLNSAFMSKYEDRGKPVHVAQNGTVTTELPLIPAVSR
jgi:hypothetical protein